MDVLPLRLDPWQDPIIHPTSSFFFIFFFFWTDLVIRPFFF